MHAHRQRREKTEECLLDFGRERNTTRTGGQQLHLHESTREESINHTKRTKSRAGETGKTRPRQENTKERVQEQESKKRQGRVK